MTVHQDDLIHLLNQTVRWMNQKVNVALQPYGLYHSQWSILYCVHKFNTLTQKEIATYLSVEAPTITRTVKKLMDNDWIIREKGQDKRANQIYLTEKTKAEIAQISESITAVYDEVLASLTGEQHKQLRDILLKLMREVCCYKWM